MEKHFSYIKDEINALNFKVISDLCDSIEYEIEDKEHLVIKKLSDKIMYKQGIVNGLGHVSGTWGILVSIDDNNVANINDFIKQLEERQASILQKKSMLSFTGKRIVEPHILGTDSRKVYDHGVKIYGFDPQKADSYGMNGDLYALDCTPEHYNVWFCKNTQLAGFNIKNSVNYFNLVFEDKIYEMWKDESNNDKSENDRVIYGLDRKGYFLLGLYKYTGCYPNQIYQGVPVSVRVFEKVPNTQY